MRSRWVLALGSLFLTLLLAELALQVLDLPPAQQPPTFVGAQHRELGLVPDRDCFWRLDQSVSYWSINGLGLRGQPPLPNKSATTYRIACAGDSCTFGVGVTYEQTYGMRVERALQERIAGGAVETILAATPAFSSHQTRALYEKVASPLRPDLTIVYCGAWNDYQPKIEGATDRELGQRLSSRGESSVRILRAISRLSFDDVRVPLTDFEANVRTIVSLARTSGGSALLIVPPVRADTARKHPICLEYQATVRRLATELELPFVDGPAVFEKCATDAGPEWMEQPENGSLLFVDGAHPSPFGHDLLARAALGVIQANADDKLARLLASSAATERSIRVDSVEPRHVPALTRSELTLRGRGFATAGAFHRVWVGDVACRTIEVVSDTEMRTQLPWTVRPGQFEIALRTPHGPIATGVLLEIDAPRLEVKATASTTGTRLEVTAHGPADRQCGIYLGTAIASTPAWTLYGPFALALGSQGRPATYPGFPFRFPPVVAHGVANEHGIWKHAIDLPPASEELWVQGVVLATQVSDQAQNGPIGALTGAVRVTIPE